MFVNTSDGRDEDEEGEENDANKDETTAVSAEATPLFSLDKQKLMQSLHHNHKMPENAEFVNSLVEGNSFGERALESEDSTRTATVVTEEKLTELLVISRDIYRQYVGGMKTREQKEKVQLLIKSQCFGSLQEKQLVKLASFMEPRKFHMDRMVRADLSIRLFNWHKVLSTCKYCR